ncbi:MAG: PaaI family thioesterase [Deltaproteobacteria bacterium]|nr:PaaI family thioesterase [Deltaproteobacteria bacterium]
MTIEFNEHVIEAVRGFMRSIPFNAMLGFELEELGPGYARMRLPFREDLIGDFIRGALHGGAVAALIDTCGGACVWTGIEIGDTLSTVDFRVDYLRPGRREDVVAEARLLRLGNRVGVTDIVAFHASAPGEPIATGKGVYNVRRSRRPQGVAPSP